MHVLVVLATHIMYNVSSAGMVHMLSICDLQPVCKAHTKSPRNQARHVCSQTSINMTHTKYTFRLNISCQTSTMSSTEVHIISQPSVYAQ